MANELQGPEPTMDPTNLYREEIITDRRVGTIRLLTPIATSGAGSGGGLGPPHGRVTSRVTADLVLRYAAPRHRACRAAGQRCRDGAHRQQPDPRQRDDARRGEAGENGAEAATDGSSDSRALGHLAAELRLLTIGEESAPAVFRHQEHHVVLVYPRLISDS